MAPQTLTRQTSGLHLYLDTDLDEGTGYSDSLCRGVEFIVSIVPFFQDGFLFSCSGTQCGAGVSSPSLRVIWSTDAIELTVPLAELDGDDGRMAVRMTADYATWDFFVPVDFLPEIFEPAAVLQ